MSEQAIYKSSPSHSALIDEVFIRPIRTVTVVDDEFPTLDDFLKANHELDARKERNKSRAQEILAFCRDESRRWLVDIHDGNSNKEGVAVANHLHNSDLLILDYHLDRLSERGEKAIRILRELAKSPHFNLVIVYTAADDLAGGDISRTVGEIALGLSCKDEKLEWTSQGVNVVKDALDEWGDYVTDITSRLISEIDPLTFVRIRWDEKRNLKDELARNEWASFNAIIASAKDFGIKVVASAVFKYCLSQVQQNLGESFSPENLGKVAVGIDDAGANWIRTGSLFVTVVSKRHKPAELPSKLSRALLSWDPFPQRLILSKLRAQLDAVGSIAENEILSNRHLQAGWLEELLSEADRSIPSCITLERNWESLGDAIRWDMMEYSNKLAKSLREIGDIKHRCFETEAPLDFAIEMRQICIESNIYACSKQVSGSHLAVGHILKMVRNEQDLYWICLTPACDLVPGREDSGWKARLGTWMPFKAVQLFPEKADIALLEATRANHLFLRIENTFHTFGFSPNPSALSNPRWEQMFAKNSGIFDDVGRHLAIADLSASDKGELATGSITAQVVAQLRYEYALNLLQRLGGNLSRIGLDFQMHKPEQAKS